MSNSKRPRSRVALLSVAAVLCAVLCAGVGCGRFWGGVRENEREYAVSNAKKYAESGKCDRALAALDRAEARIDLGLYAATATRIRIICYEKLGRHAASRAHRRLLEDFYGPENPAYPKEDGSSVFRVTTLPSQGFQKPPSALALVSPNYTDYARRAHIVGRVVIAFELTADYKPKAIRVLEMPHPLLASWSIEAVERSGLAKKATPKPLVPGDRYVAHFAFEHRYATSGKQVEGEKDEAAPTP